jgi:hypothetical protein
VRVVGLVLLLAACGGAQPRPGKHVTLAPPPPRATPVTTVEAPDLPPVPELPKEPIKRGDAYTVYGAVHQLHSRYHRREVEKVISVIGVVAETNLAAAPKCAVHHTGKADPPGCVAPVPAFALADVDQPSAPKIVVMGWASNFANVYEASLRYAKGPHAKPYVDELWAVVVPNPLPAVGATVRVTGHYGVMFTRSTSGVATDPNGGILTADRVETLTPAKTPAKLP